MKDKYVFDRMDMALYKEGLKAHDFLPKHGMIVTAYEEPDVLLQLIVYSPEKTAQTSRFAWAWYGFNEEKKAFELDEVELAVFDENKGEFEQQLPSKKKLGMMIYGMLTGITL